MTPPKLIDADRKMLVGLLVAVALTSGIAAACSAEAIRIAIDAQSSATFAPIAILGALAMLAGLTVLGERWIAERLAQSFVIATRGMLFDAVIANGTSGREARWLTPMVSDLAALRNWAARGPVRLISSSLSGCAATIWFMVAWQDQILALLPLAAGMSLVLLASPSLTRAISDQRNARGSLTRFLIRRVRAEVTGMVSPRRHGRKTLAERSRSLGSKAEKRAFLAGTMEASGVASGALSALLLVLITLDEAMIDRGGLVAGLALIGFIATRISEIARALHAHAGGKVAIQRVARLLAVPVQQECG